MEDVGVFFLFAALTMVSVVLGHLFGFVMGRRS